MLLMDGKSMNTTAHSLRVTEAASCFSNDVCEYFLCAESDFGSLLSAHPGREMLMVWPSSPW